VTTAGGRGDYLDRLRDVDALLFDGTFWSEDEMPAQGLSKSHARDMAHWPVGGESGSLSVLVDKAPRIRIYTHINNTNPLLREGSPERAEVERAGFVVARDGTDVFP
jgi:pyrroloquinoline quinone biosynthesis protein B